MKRKRIFLFATLGFPGSGKTYFSERFAKEYGVIHLNSDRIRGYLTKRPRYTSEELSHVFVTMNLLAEYLIASGISVVYDANSTKRIYRKKLRDIARRYKADYLLFNFKTPVELAEKRLIKRSALKAAHKIKIYRPLTADILHVIRKENEEPQKSEPHVNIDGTKSYKEQVKSVRHFLKRP